MPTWKSVKGIWKPAKERAYVPPDAAKGREEGYIYEGEDRQARASLTEQGVDHLGTPVEQDPEIIYRARQMGMTVPEFLELHKTPTPQTIAADKKKDEFVQVHKPDAPKPAVQPQGGRAPERPESEGGAFGDAPVAAKPVQS